MSTARILIIAGSDSGGGAGIQADIKAVTMLGGHAMTAITAITAQNTLGVQAVHAVPPDMVLAQIDSVVGDIGVDAVKIGMIGSAVTATEVAERLARLDGVPIVFDPVMVATSGSVLADEGTIAAFRALMGLATLVTPNLPELAALGGVAVASAEDMEVAARHLMKEHGSAILAKGGHLPSAGDEGVIRDLLVTPQAVITFTNPRIETRHSHGTGCTLASAIATGLGQGATLDAAVGRAEAFVAAALAAAPGLGGGHGPMGHALGTVPFYHLLAARDGDGFDAAAHAARYAGDAGFHGGR
ncbi:bifunctional hydroxymethylpyrimidine kinase/phosphomethylpyrimidine kinase [Sphingobium sufflavum]|uniref:bifunctional hydroxymethylpyrimidine kinase/phosphomethylpyrimidine kinase n=1 Tax=Sphingobium sufflavum TaxID=1129547 RepID=UPI001F21129C|nr:bifunctional hydroxymethylpyrimidine kinase/phosphomethylpyrimidine kinase [Sphingobium sufflavum]MCE7797305.1 bifunctional hydroxymethylpyrimidine kinase/phosphomethylpyrimidine kinase [Sphingobium sufflavum]